MNKYIGLQIIKPNGKLKDFNHKREEINEAIEYYNKKYLNERYLKLIRLYKDSIILELTSFTTGKVLNRSHLIPFTNFLKNEKEWHKYSSSKKSLFKNDRFKPAMERNGFFNMNRKGESILTNNGANHIDRVSVKRYKSIESITVDMDRINLVIGGNNSGKSSFLQALHFGIACGKTFDLVTKHSKRNQSTTVSFDELIYRPIENVKLLGSSGTIGRIDNEKHIEIEYFCKNSSALIQIESGRFRGNVVSLRPHIINEYSKTVFASENHYSYYVTGLAGINSYEELRTTAIVNEIAVKGNSNSVLRNIVYRLAIKEKTTNSKMSEWDNFSSNLRRIFNDIEIVVDVDEINNKYLNINAKVKEELYPIDSLGTSVLQVIQILSYIHYFEPSLVILDEPDAHLHPNNQLKLIDVLVELTNEKDIQLVIATHSHHIIDKLLYNSNLIWLDQGKVIDIDDIEKSYVRSMCEIGALERGRLLDNKHYKIIVLTEDKNTTLLRVILESNGFNLNETDIWSYEGCTRFDNAVILSKYIGDRYKGIKILIHRDRDFIPEEGVESLKEKYDDAQVNCYFTEGTDLEYYFTTFSHINYIYPNVSNEMYHNILDESLDELNEESKSLFISSRKQSVDKLLKDGINIEGYNANRDLGNFSLKCISEYEENRHLNTKGKRLLRRMRGKLQSQLKDNVDLIKSSPKLKNLKLMGLAQDVWN